MIQQEMQYLIMNGILVHEFGEDPAVLGRLWVQSTRQYRVTHMIRRKLQNRSQYAFNRVFQFGLLTR